MKIQHYNPFTYGLSLIALTALAHHALADVADGSTVYYMVYGPNTIGNDVSILIQSNSATPFGLYTNGGTGANLNAGNNLTIVVGAFDDADGIRTNPSGSSNWSGASSVTTIGNGLNVTTNGNSGDCANINGYCTLIIGDDCKLLSTGTAKATYSEGAHGLRANHAAQITVGKNLQVETRGNNSHGLYAASGQDSTSTNPATSNITVGDNATILTTGGTNLLGGSYGAYVQATNGKISFEGISRITTEGASAYALYASGANSKIETGGKATIKTLGSNSHGVYASGANATVDLKNGSSITTSGSKAHGIYSNGTSSIVTLDGGTTIDNSAADSYSIYANRGTVTGTGQFILDNAARNASLYAASGTIDLTMQQSSVFMGYTAFSSGTATGRIDLAMQSSTNWTLSQSSELSTLSTDATSSITFTLYGQNDYTKILARESAILEANSTMNVVLNGYAPVVNDAFQLVAVNEGGTYTADNVLFDFSKAQLAEGLHWDTSTFHTDGTIRITGIPEPSAVSFGLLGLSTLLARRSRKSQ